MADLDDGARAINRLIESLRAGDSLTEPYAEAVLREAQSRAQGKPTPQARMAADAMVRQGSQLIVLAEGPPAEVSGGSEWGSSIYKQFGPRNEGGYWLMPATESTQALDAGDRALEDVMQAAIRGFSFG